MSLEELAPVMHVAETWEEGGGDGAVVRTSRSAALSPDVDYTWACRPGDLTCVMPAP